jgi:hypothetical protein
MNNKRPILTIAQLIEELKKYSLDTGVSHLVGNQSTSKEISDLYLVETNPIGDRDTEEKLLLVFSNNPTPFN